MVTELKKLELRMKNELSGINGRIKNPIGQTQLASLQFQKVELETKLRKNIDFQKRTNNSFGRDTQQLNASESLAQKKQREFRQKVLNANK